MGGCVSAAPLLAAMEMYPLYAALLELYEAGAFFPVLRLCFKCCPALPLQCNVCSFHPDGEKNQDPALLCSKRAPAAQRAREHRSPAPYTPLETEHYVAGIK